MNILCNLEKIMHAYGVDELWINVKGSNEPIKIPMLKDIYIPLKVYISHDNINNELVLSQRLINKKNHYLSTLLDDFKNGRINIKDYYYRPEDDNA